MYHLFSQHSVDKGIKRRSERHSSMYSSVKLVDRIMEDLFVLVCGERLANEDFEFMEAMWVVLEAFTPGDRLDQSRHEVSMFLLEIYVELWLKFGIEQDMAPYSYTPMEDLEFDSPAELDGWKTHVIRIAGDQGLRLVWYDGSVEACLGSCSCKRARSDSARLLLHAQQPCGKGDHNGRRARARFSEVGRRRL